MKYRTYTSANPFAIEVDGEWYGLSSIDGAYDTAINGLTYEYRDIMDTEYLHLGVEKEIVLSTDYMHEGKPEKTLILQPKSGVLLMIPHEQNKW